MRNQAVKRILALLLCLTQLCMLFSGCKSDGEESSGFTVPDAPSGTTAQVVAEDGETKELPLITMVIDSPAMPSLFVSSFLSLVPGYGTEFQVSFELINPLVMVTEGNDGKPKEDPKIYLNRMRTEMMAGKGPDIFLCDCASTVLWRNEEQLEQPAFEEPTFHYPEKAMRNNLFLPLNQYMDKAEFMEWDEMNSAIMAAGSYEGEQYLLPIKYLVNMTCFDPAVFELPGESMTVQEMLASGKPVLEYAALPVVEYQHLSGLDQTYTDFLAYFGAPASYEEDLPSFTEEELLDLALAGLGNARKGREGYYDALFSAPEGAFLSGPNGRFLYPGSGYDQLPSYVMIPSYNREGGVTASVTCYAGINANTEHPEEAFLVLDRLLSKEVQRDEYITNSISGISVYDELGSPSEPVGGSGKWWMNEANYASFCAIREQINAVKFYTLLDQEAMFTLSRACLAEDATEESVKTAVHSVYTTMKMMLAES